MVTQVTNLPSAALNFRVLVIPLSLRGRFWAPPSFLAKTARRSRRRRASSARSENPRASSARSDPAPLPAYMKPAPLPAYMKPAPLPTYMKPAPVPPLWSLAARSSARRRRHLADSLERRSR
jgi:hypothetical protein